jgi:hypothetical protein
VSSIGIGDRESGPSLDFAWRLWSTPSIQQYKMF